MPAPKIQYKLEILSLLWLKGPRNLSDLARVTNYNFVTVKELLRDLERKEFVRVYTRTYPSGVRRYTIEITQRGINLARTYEKLKRILEGEIRAAS